jgi:3-phenylpropionate/trans-cinnamate dioxygenase ferredoxin reductase subunit
MPDFRYLIIGGGMTADAAARAIREVDKDGDIGVLCEEPDPPYARPPLSKGLWKGEALESVGKRTDEVGVSLLLGKRAVRIEPDARQVVDHRGATYGYHKLLIATGTRTRKLVTGGDRVVYYRTLADYRRVREVAAPGKRVVVIGGGFIGSEMAAALAGQECKVTMVVSGTGIGARLFPADLVRFLNGYYEERGVALQLGQSAIGLQTRGRKHSVATLGGADLPADLVVAGIGGQPNVELAEAAGLPTGDGIVVDDRLRAGRPEIFAAGDVARFTNPALGEAIRVEHEDAAVTMGRHAGRGMAGADDGPYTHLPFFYSDLFDLGYEAVGELDPRLETVADWKVPFREGVVYYLENKRVRGVLLWGIFGKVDVARALIAEGRDVRGSVKGWV